MQRGDAERLMKSLESYAKIVDRALNEVLNQEKGSIFFTPLAEFIRGGKRVRPIILLLSNEACGGGGEPVPAAAAIELIHTASLIHDDLIDRDVKRRGKNAFHVENGEEMAILAADFILALVLKIASRYEDKSVGETLSWASKRMSEGELLEIMYLRRGRPITLDEYLKVLELKTATLFEASSKLGAIIAGRKDLVEALASYGRHLGLAYQIKDDLLDWGSERELSSLVSEGSTSFLEGLAEEYFKEAYRSLDPLEETEAKRKLIEIAGFAIKRVY